jgi:hypothetical protein
LHEESGEQGARGKEPESKPAGKWAKKEDGAS